MMPGPGPGPGPASASTSAAPAAAHAGPRLLPYPPISLLFMPVDAIMAQQARFPAWDDELKREQGFARARLACLQAYVLRHYARHGLWVRRAAMGGELAPAQMDSLPMHERFALRGLLEEMAGLLARLRELEMEIEALAFIRQTSNRLNYRIHFLTEGQGFLPYWQDGPHCFDVMLDYANLRMLQCEPEQVMALLALPVSRRRAQEAQDLRFKINRPGPFKPQMRRDMPRLQFIRAQMLDMLRRDLPKLPHCADSLRLFKELAEPRFSDWFAPDLSLGGLLALKHKARLEIMPGCCFTHHPLAGDYAVDIGGSAGYWWEEAARWGRGLGNCLREEAALSAGSGIIAPRFVGHDVTHVAWIDIDGPVPGFMDPNIGYVRLPPAGLDSSLLHYLIAQIQLRHGAYIEGVYAFPGAVEEGVRWHPAPRLGPGPASGAGVRRRDDKKGR